MNECVKPKASAFIQSISNRVLMLEPYALCNVTWFCYADPHFARQTLFTAIHSMYSTSTRVVVEVREKGGSAITHLRGQAHSLAVSHTGPLLKLFAIQTS